VIAAGMYQKNRSPVCCFHQEENRWPDGLPGG